MPRPQITIHVRRLVLDAELGQASITPTDLASIIGAEYGKDADRVHASQSANMTTAIARAIWGHPKVMGAPAAQTRARTPRAR